MREECRETENGPATRGRGVEEIKKREKWKKKKRIQALDRGGKTLPGAAVGNSQDVHTHKATEEIRAHNSGSNAQTRLQLGRGPPVSEVAASDELWERAAPPVRKSARLNKVPGERVDVVGDRGSGVIAQVAKNLGDGNAGRARHVHCGGAPRAARGGFPRSTRGWADVEAVDSHINPRREVGPVRARSMPSV